MSVRFRYSGYFKLSEGRKGDAEKKPILPFFFLPALWNTDGKTAHLVLNCPHWFSDALHNSCWTMGSIRSDNKLPLALCATAWTKDRDHIWKRLAFPGWGVFLVTRKFLHPQFSFSWNWNNWQPEVASLCVYIFGGEGRYWASSWWKALLSQGAYLITVH